MEVIHNYLFHICPMFKKLKQHWNVNDLNLALILLTFAVGGSLCGYAGRKLLLITGIDKGPFWYLLYILLIIILWPACVIMVSIFLGQFPFFKRYIQRIVNRFKGGSHPQEPVNIAIFASGAGTNAQQIINHFRISASIKVTLVVCNKPGAGVLDIARKEQIPSMLIDKKRFFSGDHYLGELQQNNIGHIVLAGFLWKLPEAVIRAYPKKIINIHPALLPKYGGKGMYGPFVHEAVIANHEKESGITIHYVDELYDHGEIIFQANCPVEEKDTPESLAQKIHVLEHTNYAAVIEKIIMNGLST